MDLNGVVAALKEQRTRLDHAIAALEASSSSANRRGRPPKTSSASAGTRRHMSPAARKRISEAMKQRWAKWKGKSVPKTSTATKTKGRRGMSAASRKKLSALMKARWAARNKAAA